MDLRQPSSIQQVSAGQGWKFRRNVSSLLRMTEPMFVAPSLQDDSAVKSQQVIVTAKVVLDSVTRLFCLHHGMKPCLLIAEF